MSEPRRQEAREHFAHTARWDHGVGWRGAWAEQTLGGLQVTVPGSWKREADGPVWEIPDRARISVHMVGFEKKAPPVKEYLHHLENTDRKGYERVGLRAVGHPHDGAPAGAAMELFEHAPAPPAWPVRWMRVAAWTGTSLLCLELDADGLIPEDLGADFARMWRSLSRA